jgi:FimV-like protein
MKRKLTIAVLFSLSAASPLALGLGLGDAEVRSTLDAPLRASIPLIDARGLSPDLLNVSVADERSFSAAGLIRTPLAASVRLDVTDRQGQLMLDLTTERPVAAPWLDLLLRFDWPGGGQVREVTLLLDPADYDLLPVLVAASRPALASPTPTSSTPREPTTQPQVARPPAPAQSDDASRIRSGDTLWVVAGRLRPDSGIGMNQMMVSLVEANPDAFPSGNINAMRAGYTLVVPSRDAIAARSSAEAERIVQAMNQAWANRGGGAPPRVALGTPAADPEVDPVADSALATAASAEAASPAEPMANAEEVGPSPPPGDAAAQQAEVPRLTLLTDAEIAAEEDPGAPSPGMAAEGEGGGNAEAPQVNIDPAVLQALYGEGSGEGSGELTGDARLQHLGSRWRETQQALEAMREERDEIRQELEALRELVAGLSTGGQGIAGAGTSGVVSPGAEAGDETPWWGAWYQGALDRPLMLGGAALAALLALWALIRYRRREDEGITFGQLHRASVGDSGVARPASGPETPRGETVTLGFGMPQAEAINEADIFIAYGRYDQARELLESSLEQHPERDDLRLKLLRVHVEQGNQASAEREASRLKASGDAETIADRIGYVQSSDKRAQQNLNNLVAAIKGEYEYSG